MIRRLRLRLGAVCAALMGAFVLAIAFGASAVGQRDVEMPRQALFQSLSSQIADQLLLEGAVRNDWLGRLEAEHRLVIAIEDNGSPLFFPGIWNPRTPRAELLVKARGQARTLGFDRLDFTAMNHVTEQVGFILSGGNGDSYRCSVGRVLTEGGGYSLTILADRTEELSALRRQNSRIWLLAAAGLAGAAALGWGIAGIAVRPAQESLEEQNRFLAAVSHDLRSPLAAVNACACAVLAEPERSEEYVGTISRECARLGKLLDDLMLLVQTQSAAWDLPKEPLVLDTLLIETVEGLAPMAKNHHHNLTISLPGEEELPQIEGNAKRLGQALYNLIVNAVSYAGGTGPIEVSGRCSGNRVLITVTDHGAGIPDEEKAKVFQRFYQQNKARGDKSHFGLGLSTAWEIVRLHGGKLLLSDTPGGGCTFTISLPVKPTRQP